MVRVQVLMREREREEFRRMARRSGLSLSAWLRQAGLEVAERQRGESRLDSPQALTDFFALCDLEEQGIEPDWTEHEKVIERSRRRGESGT